MLEKLVELTNHVYKHDLPFGPLQIFMTSHNPTSLDAFDLFDDEQRVFVVARDSEGATTATRLQPPSGMSREEWKIAAGGRNLSQMWLENMIEGANGIEGL